MVFKECISSITSFYKHFNDVFERIDNLLQEITDVGGKKDDAIYKVINLLTEFQSKCYQDTDLSQGNPVEYVRLSERVKSMSESMPSVDIIEYVNVIKDLREIICNALVNDTDWQGQELGIDIINNVLRLLGSITNYPDEQTTSYYAAVRILREIVADCSITICALQPLSKWNYGTIDYAQLNAEEQLIALINQAILIDRMYFCLYSLEIVLDRVDKVASTFQRLDWYVYYVVGFLNFKIHNYGRAIKYFEKVIYIKELEQSSREETKNLYFRAMLFIVYSYEYSGEFGMAIEKIAIPTEQLDEILKQYSLIGIKENINDIMTQIRKESLPTSLFHHFIDSFTGFRQKAEKNKEKDKEQLEKQFEILHAFSHCLNEYAIQCMKEMDNEKKGVNYGKLIYMAREVMHTLSEYRREYLTCYATIHGEYQDYYQALEELNIAEEIYSKEEKLHDKETLVAEVKFFKYYFGLLCNQVYENEKRKFEEYYYKYDDNDAECYLKIFEFRNELRKYLSILYSDIRNADNLFSKENITPISEILSLKYEGLCKLNPTLYMNVNVRTELRLMQRAYICICKLREFLIYPTSAKLLDLRNASYRFLCVKREFSLNAHIPTYIGEAELVQDENYDDLSEIKDYENLPKIVKQAFLPGKASILDCLFNTDSIFILAPISGVIVFQYQTGMISKLFDLDEQKIFPDLEDSKKLPINEVADAMFDNYSEMSADYDQRKLNNINWDTLKRYTEIVYYWGSDVPSQVIVAKFNDSSYVRKIVDIDTFSKTLEEIKQKFDNTNHPKCTDRTRYRNIRCSLQSEKLPWLEIINEKFSEEKFFVMWDDIGEFKCFIIPFSDDGNKSKHKLHSIIRNISIEYDTEEVVFKSEIDEVTVDEMDSVLNDICKRVQLFIGIQKNKICQRILATKERIDKFENDTNNGNVHILEKKNKEDCEQLQKIEEIEKRYKNSYKNITLVEAENDLNYLEDLK